MWFPLSVATHRRVCLLTQTAVRRLRRLGKGVAAVRSACCRVSARWPTMSGCAVALSASWFVSSEPRSTKSPRMLNVGCRKVAGLLCSTKKCARIRNRGITRAEGAPRVALFSIGPCGTLDGFGDPLPRPVVKVIRSLVNSGALRINAWSVQRAGLGANTIVVEALVEHGVWGDIACKTPPASPLHGPSFLGRYLSFCIVFGRHL